MMAEEASCLWQMLLSSDSVPAAPLLEAGTEASLETLPPSGTLAEPGHPLPFRARSLDYGHDLTRGRLMTLQVNVGKVCNQACRHCHVEAGPARTEAMDRRTAEAVLEVLAALEGVSLDLTGGAPELNPHFGRLVEGGRALGREVTVRTNLTVLLLPAYEGYPQWYADQGVHLIASLPCYTRENVEAQRGPGVFAHSLEALRRLNAAGYGLPGSGLQLDLVYNPGGPFLPGDQAELEVDYREELAALGLSFNRLLTLANLPLGRFRADLERQGRGRAALEEYMALLYQAYNPATLPHLMCHSLLSVGYDGTLYDCDFNQMLDLPLSNNGHALWPSNIAAGSRGSPATSTPSATPATPPMPATAATAATLAAAVPEPQPSPRPPRTIYDLAALAKAPDNGGLLAALQGLPIAVAGHCYGCTAGAGTSCGGALVGG